MDENRMLELAEGLAEAKSRQDVEAALTFLHAEMVLENPAFGTRVAGHAENRAALSRWFAGFPDYSVEFDGHAANDEELVCWGTARMTMTGDRFGVSPNGRRAELPVYIRFGFREDAIAEESFFFDLSSLCAQSGVSTDAVRVRLFGEAHASSGKPAAA